VPTRFEQQDLFVAGHAGYHTYRIPSLIATPRGALLAFCEGRRHSRGDSGAIDLLLRRSPDGGASWEPPRVVARDAENTVGNPCPVIDYENARVLLLHTRNRGEDNEAQILAGTSQGTRTVWLTTSDDDGLSWLEPREITPQAKAPDWTWYATGPGVGIQLRSGRLVIPCDHALAGSRLFRSHVIVSDDGGEGWRIGGVAGDHTNECQVAERGDGSLLLNMRSYHGQHRRAVATSEDGGLSWSAVTLDPALIEPVCQASLIRLDDANADRLLFANPASTTREKLTVRLSEDGGRTWPVARLIEPGPAAYSALCALPDGDLACLYERGVASPYERLTLARFSISWLRENGA
jgi:sialidase-1